MKKIAVYLETYGCAFNQADSEAMAGVLTQAGHLLTREAALADVIILNTCTVKDRTYLNFEKRLRELKAQAQLGGARLVVAGCIPKAQAQTELLQGISLMGPDMIGRAAEVVEQTVAGQIRVALRPQGQDDQPARTSLPTHRANPIIEILPIARGCLSVCTFCQTRLARGPLVSFRPGDLLEKARQAIADGVKEIWITAQDTGAYGQDCNYPLPRLLRNICSLDGDFMVRLGMSSPHWILIHLDEFLDVLAHPKMFQFLHLPVQTGSERVLLEMRRHHTVEQFEQVAQAFQNRFPDGCMMTDIIAGYPTETEADFEATLAMLQRVKPAATNRSKYSSRPGTAAARLSPLPASVLTNRSLRLMDVSHRLGRQYHQTWVGRHDRVLVDDEKKGTMIAHNRSYRPVILTGQHPKGVWLDIAYAQAANYHLHARPIHS